MQKPVAVVPLEFEIDTTHRGSGRTAFPNVSARAVVTIFLLLLVLKALIAFALIPGLTRALGENYKSNLFPDDYDLIADNLINGHGYRVYTDTSETMLRSPGFVLVLAGIFALFGKSLLMVQVIQYLMSVVTAVIVYLISQRLFRVKLVSLFAVFLFLFHPISMLSDTRAGTDTTLTLCLTGTIWLLLKAIDSQSWWVFVLSGLTLGYTMLVKATVALIFPVVFLFLILTPKFRGSLWVTLGQFVLVAITAALVMTPWVVRNYNISGRFVPTMTVTGLAIFQGEEAERNAANGEDSKDLLDDAAEEQVRIGHEMGLRMREEFFPQFYRIQDEISFYDELGRRGWDQYREHPALLARIIVHNSWAFWFQGRTSKATLINIIVMLPFILISLCGAVIAVRRQRRSWILVIAVVMYILPHLLIIAVARYSSAVVPLMCVLAAGILFMPALRHLMFRDFSRA
jgi:4-amino-4-deoxy-L-arabinose transferase-like glycosyltransferase